MNASTKTLNDLSERVLSKTQSKILLVLLDQSSSSSAEIRRITGVSTSSWNKERRLLENIGLIVSWNDKDLTDRGIVRKTWFRLTPRGKLAAEILLVISQLIS